MKDLLCKPLFDKHVFYANGRVKPPIRGLIHLMGCFVIMPILWIYFLRKYTLNKTNLLSMSLFTMGCCLCWFFSFIYHFFDFKLTTEIILQKFDYAFIFLKIFCLWSALFVVTLKPERLTQALTIYGLGLLLALIGIFIFNWTSQLVIAGYVGLIVFFLPDILTKYPFINTLFWLFIALQVVQLLIVRYKISLVPFIHYQDSLHLINVGSMVTYAYMLFKIFNKTT